MTSQPNLAHQRLTSVTVLADSPSLVAEHRLTRPLVATVLVATTGVLPTFLAGALGVQLRKELGFREAGLGQAIGGAFLLAALCSIAFGRTAERLGPVRSMRIAAALSAVTMVAVAVGTHSLVSFCVLLLSGGVANAMSQPATNLYVSRVVPPHRQGLAFAVKQSAVPGATLLGGLAVPTIALTVGWRWTYIAGAVLAVAGGFTSVEVGGSAGSPSAAPGRRDQPIDSLVLLGAGVGFGALASASLGSFMTSSLHRSGFSEGNSGLLAACGSVLVMTVRMILGARSDRTARSQFPVVAGLLAVGAIGFTVMSGMSRWALLGGGLLAYAFGWGWPGLFNLSIARANPNGPAAASGVTQTGTYLGVAVGPFLFGWIAEHIGYGSAYLAAAASGLAGAACVVVGARRIIPLPS